MTRTAYLIRAEKASRHPVSSTIEQRLYRCDPPMLLRDDSGTTEYVVVSRALDVGGSGPETYIFASDSTGNVDDWSELHGSAKGDITHAEALGLAGYAVTALLDHPSADRRAIVAGEVRVMLRDIACASVAAALGGRVGDRERWERASVEVVKLLDAGDVGNAHTVATQALYPAGASAGVSSVGQVRT